MLGATSYQLQQSPDSSFATVTTSSVVTGTGESLVEDVGSYVWRVRGCSSLGCGPYSNTVTASVTVAPLKQCLPLIAAH